MEFHQHLKELRISNHLSQSDVAEKLNISRQSVSKWENGWSYPDLENLLLLSKLYNVSLEELTQRDGQIDEGLEKTEKCPEQENTIFKECDIKILIILLFVIGSMFVPVWGTIFAVWILIKYHKKEIKFSRIFLILIIICLVVNINNTYIILDNLFFYVGGTATIK